MKNEEVLADKQFEKRKKTVVYVLKYLANTYSDFRYDEDTIVIWMESLEKFPKDTLVNTVKEWCNLHPKKPVLADFRQIASTKLPYTEIKKEAGFRLFRDENGYDYAEILN